MKRFAALAFLIATATAAMGQAVRADISLQTYGPNVPTQGGPLPQALWIANATVQICAHPATTNSCTPITTYNDSAKDITCPADAQLVQLPGVACTNAAGTAGNVGFWYDGGLVDYIFTSSYGTFGPYSYSNGGGGGGSGCTTSGPPGTFQVANGTGGCAPGTVSVNGVPLITPNPVNHVDSPTVQFLNPSAGNITANVIPGSALAIQVEDSAAGVNQATLDFNSTLPAAPAGFQNVHWQNDTATGRLSGYVLSAGNTLKPLVTPPVDGQYVVLYPHVFTAGPAVGGATVSGDATGAVLFAPTQCSLTESVSGTWSGYTLADYGIPAGNVTAIYAAATSSLSGVSTGRLCLGTPAGFGYAPGGVVAGPSSTLISPSPLVSPWVSQQVTAVLGITGTGIATATSTASLGTSSQTQIQTTMQVAAPVLIVYYTGSPVTSPSYLNIDSPLQYNGTTNTLSVDPTYPTRINAYTVASAPNPLNGFGTIIAMRSSTNCVSDDSVDLDMVLCKSAASGSSYVWAPLTTGGGGITALTGDVTAAGSGSVPATLANTAVTPGSYTNSNITVDSKGRLTSAANGSAGGSGLSGQTTTCLPKAATATTSTSSSAVCDSGTVITSTEPLSIAPGGGQGGTFDATEGTAPSGASGHDVLYADSAAHCFKQSLNGGSFSCLGAAAGTVTTSGSPASGDIAAFSSSTAITTATSTQINTLIKTLTGCNTAGFFYSPQGADCVAASGSGTVSGQASGVIPLGTSATAISNQSHLDDGNSTAATITSTEPIAVSVTGASQESFTYNATPIVPGSGTTAVIGASSAGLFTVSEAGGSVVQGCTAGNTACNKLSGMTATQVPIAATASTVTSSKAIQGTDTNLLSAGTVAGTGATLCTSANGGATTSGCSAGASPWTNITASVTSSCNGTACSVASGALVIAGTTTTTVTLSAIPAHNRMQIVWWGAGSADGVVWLTFNSDSTGAHYTFNGSYQQNTANPLSNTGASSANGLDSGGIGTGVSQSIFEVPFYADTSFGKAITGHNSAFDSATSLTNNFDVAVGGYWNQTTAITSTLFTISTGHFVAGTKFMILVQD